MQTRHIIGTILLNLIVISGVIGLSACTAIPGVQMTGSGFDSQVNTAVAATMIYYIVETKVAEQATAQGLQPVAQVQATNTPAPAPTATPVPTEVPPPTAVPTVEPPPPTPTAIPTAVPAAPAANLTIRANQHTNCRAGPATGYDVVAYFMKGTTSTVVGRDAGWNWWYIVNPNDSSKYCWVWDGSTTVEGDPNTLAVVEAPVYADVHTNYPYYDYNDYCNPYSWDGCYGYYGYGYNDCGIYPYNYPYPFPYNNNCWGSGDWWNTGYCPPSPYPQNCNSIRYWKCNQHTGICKWVYQNPCKKSGCPALTIVNYKNYCKNYPKCCAD